MAANVKITSAVWILITTRLLGEIKMEMIDKELTEQWGHGEERLKEVEKDENYSGTFYISIFVVWRE